MPCQANVGEFLQGDGLLEAMLVVHNVNGEPHVGRTHKHGLEAVRNGRGSSKKTRPRGAIRPESQMQLEITLCALKGLRLEEGSTIGTPRNMNMVANLKDHCVG